jgi:hypothetical protein
MKKTRSSPKSGRRDPDVHQAIGGQPENDRDARDAGLSSATSANGGDQTKRRRQRQSPPTAKAKNRA